MLSKDRLHFINRTALKYFCLSMNENKSMQRYVLNRISIDTVRKFFIGCAPQSGLVDFCDKQGITPEELVKARFIATNNEGISYEFFSKRLMIPVFNNGMVVGFSGRSFNKNSSAKYLNSAQTKLYNKSGVLYILDYAKRFIFKYKYAILVEGYFDVLGLIDGGISNVVATCGTALSKRHARLLKRWCDYVYIVRDPDIAGIKAAERDEKILNDAQIDSKKILLPEKLDPDDFVKKYGKDRFLELLK